jgi:glycosyltransferase involved in cell wall biosynthesis
MKIHLYGNILNNGYNLTCFLRASGYNAILFLDDSSSSSQDFPWWEDTDLSPQTLPNWIKYYPFRPNFYFMGDREKKLIRDFGDGDVGLVCGLGPIIAKRADIPYAFFSYGDDLNMADVFRELKKIFAYIKKGVLPNGTIGRLLVGLIQRRALRGAVCIGICMGYQYPYVSALRLREKVRRIRLMWDIDKYSIQTDLSLFEKYKKYDRVFFMIARHTWSSLSADSFKGNDKFIKAISRYIKEKNYPNIKLVFIEKGKDIKASKELIKNLGIENYVEWVSEMNKDGIRSYNSLPNVIVVDQFWHDEWYKVYHEDLRNRKLSQFLKGNQKYPLKELKEEMLTIVSFGSGSIEALSAGRPLITTFVDKKFYNDEEPPIFNAFSEEEIYEVLLKIHEMNNQDLQKMGQKGKEFVIKYHHWKNNIHLYISLIEEALNAKKLVLQ